MGYMRVKHKDEKSLVLLREPTFFSIAVFIAFLIGAVGVFIFGSEPLLFKLIISSGAVGISCFLLDNYEMCEFDKSKSEVRTSSLHWSQYWLGTFIGLTVQPSVLAKLEDIRDVRVEEQGESTSVKRYQVILLLENGQELGITEAFTNEDVVSHIQIKDDIKSFLKDVVPTNEEPDEEASNEDEDSTEDDFEQISRAELECLKEDLPSGEVEQAGGDGEAASESRDSAQHKEEETETCEDVDEAPKEGSS